MCWQWFASAPKVRRWKLRQTGFVGFFFFFFNTVLITDKGKKNKTAGLEGKLKWFDVLTSRTLLRDSVQGRVTNESACFLGNQSMCWHGTSEERRLCEYKSVGVHTHTSLSVPDKADSSRLCEEIGSLNKQRAAIIDTMIGCKCVSDRKNKRRHGQRSECVINTSLIRLQWQLA